MFICLIERYNLSIGVCPPLDAIDKGTISYAPNNVSMNGNYTSSTVATYTCNTNYGRNGNATRTCGDDSLWSGEAPACERKGLRLLIIMRSFIVLIGCILHIKNFKCTACTLIKYCIRLKDNTTKKVIIVVIVTDVCVDVRQLHTFMYSDHVRGYF